MSYKLRALVVSSLLFLLPHAAGSQSPAAEDAGVLVARLAENGDDASALSRLLATGDLQIDRLIAALDAPSA
jgi:hypothetical protein